MLKELKHLMKNYQELPKTQIFSLIDKIHTQNDFKDNQENLEEYTELLYVLLEEFSRKGDYNSERVIFNFLLELVWSFPNYDEIVNSLSMAISLIVVDSKSNRGKKRIELFNDFIDILLKFPENKEIYSAISTGAIELIKWGSDYEILEILNNIQEKATNYPLINSIQYLNAKVFMNTLFYLAEQDCKMIINIYYQLSSFTIGIFEIEKKKSHDTKLIFHDDINEILQEATINAIINLARLNNKMGQNCLECIEGIRKIILDSEYLLRRKGKEFFRDIYRLSYVFDEFKLWEHFLDLSLINDLKNERDKNEKYKIAETKFLAVQKNMRIEEYDSLKIGRRGVKLTYDLNDINDIEKIVIQLTNQRSKTLRGINLVEEIDAIIDYDNELKEHLRETGQIPLDKKTVDELQDITTISDDLTKPVTKEKAIADQIKFLKELNLVDNNFILNNILFTNALVFAVGMFGFNSPILDISSDELINHFETTFEKKMILDLIDPLVRAITLRAARLDSNATNILLGLLNKKGMKFLGRYYKQYNFVNNIARLMGYLGRIGEKNLLVGIMYELEKVNQIILNDEEITLKIARAINEGILTYQGTNQKYKLELLEIIKELAKIHSFDVNIQIKLIEAMNFILLDFNSFNYKTKSLIAKELIDFAKMYRNNQLIEEKASLGILWSIIYSKLNDRLSNCKYYQKELDAIASIYPNSSFIQKILSIGEKLIQN